MGDPKDICKKIAMWSGFIGSLLTFTVGIVHLFDTNAKLKWPENNFTDDVNAIDWRIHLFTFVPDIFGEVLSYIYDHTSNML